MSFRDRLARLEREDGGSEFLIVRFEGGVPGYREDPMEEATKIARAKAAGARFVCLGGCGPDHE